MPVPAHDHPHRRPRASELLAPAFRKALWCVYDHLGLLIVLNLIWLALLVPVVTAPAATAALFDTARRMAHRESVGVRQYFRSFRSLFLPALFVGLFSGVIGFLLWLGIDFYSHLGGTMRYPGFLLAALLVWLGVLVALLHAHLLPVLTHGERRLLPVLRTAALLTLDNLAFTVGILVQTLALTALCILTGAGLFLVAGSLQAVLLTSGHRELLRKYRPEDPDLQDDPETRTWRDLWRPWESKARG
jgi:uncharacterized membrane protein YesL